MGHDAVYVVEPFVSVSCSSGLKGQRLLRRGGVTSHVTSTSGDAW